LWLAAGAVETREVRLHFAIRLERAKGGIEDGSGRRIFRALDSVVHPLSLSPGSHDSRFSEVGEMAGDFGLALAKDFDQIADAHFAACDEIEEAQPGAVGESREEWNQVRGGSAGGHGSIIYGLTDMSRREYIRFNEYEEGFDERSQRSERGSETEVRQRRALGG
jgi:hypothetical protein